MAINIAGYILILQLLALRFYKVALNLSIKTMPHKFKHYVGIAIYSWTLSLCCQYLKDFFNICHIEITTQTKIFCFPIIPSQERVNI